MHPLMSSSQNLLKMLQTSPAPPIGLKVHWDLPSSWQWEEQPMLLLCQSASASGKGYGRKPPLHGVYSSLENSLLLQLEYSGRSTLPSTCLQPSNKPHFWDHPHMGGTAGRLAREGCMERSLNQASMHVTQVTQLSRNMQTARLDRPMEYRSVKGWEKTTLSQHNRRSRQD